MKEALYYRVTAINNYVAAGRVARDIRSQIKVRSFELMCFTLTSISTLVPAKAAEENGTYPIGILSLHIFFVFIGTKSDISVAI